MESSAGAVSGERSEARASGVGLRNSKGGRLGGTPEQEVSERK